jgi:hypothetical protein
MRSSERERGGGGGCQRTRSVSEKNTQDFNGWLELSASKEVIKQLFVRSEREKMDACVVIKEDN